MRNLEAFLLYQDIKGIVEELPQLMKEESVMYAIINGHEFSKDEINIIKYLSTYSKCDSIEKDLIVKCVFPHINLLSCFIQTFKKYKDLADQYTERKKRIDMDSCLNICNDPWDTSAESKKKDENL